MLADPLEGGLHPPVVGIEPGVDHAAVKAQATVVGDAGLRGAADGGTVLLDEVADIPIVLQMKLLGALEHGELGLRRTTLKKNLQQDGIADQSGKD